MTHSTTQARTPASVTNGPLAVRTRRAATGDVAHLKGVLARAFDQDPFATWAIRQDERRVERYERWFDASLTRLSNRLNETHTTDDLLGCALWKRPGEWKTGIWDDLRLLPTQVSVSGWSRLRAVLDAFATAEERHEEHAPEPHFYLFVLGVEPAFQGRTIGGQLMAPVLQQCDAEGLPAYLETALERDIGFYERHGFTVREQLDLPRGAPTIWLMRREPQ